ncbi:DUF4956 domain-containing protein [Portibacter lacus]|uniref:DUF4956 domain-containing protein n=1 Tax=Portibacter lacus TaxID=1099794 RepID=A0AA37SIS3_9BACT|nr:DUF4956 domain-containing protein [Portibacter lacus]GLR15413.1 DUF4956 domain-containing protein [Portibacter lacus]
MELFGIPVFDDDFYKMLFRFVLNITLITIIIRSFYYKTSGNKTYLFTYYMIAIIVFFLCFTLKKFELDLGMALGLFAIFGIIRYRTDPMEINDMTYLFIVIGISVINSLANQKMSYAEILGANVIVIACIWILSIYKFGANESYKKVVYENIENIKAENQNALKLDLESRTGLKINRIEVGNIDFLRDLADIKIYYNNEQISES